MNTQICTCATLDLSGPHALFDVLFHIAITFQCQLGDMHRVDRLLQGNASGADLRSITCGLSDHICSKAPVESLSLHKKEGQSSTGESAQNVCTISISTTAASNESMDIE